MNGESVQVGEMHPDEVAAVRDLLADLTAEEQRHFDHPQETREEILRRLHVSRTFSGENHYLVARDADGVPLGLCWVALFDPGNGLEAEIAELYVRPEARERGVATSLATAAMELIRSSGVTFASVWTRGDNEAALAVYRAAGFAPTEQTVLTWLPL
ncbi:MAG: GNAT family N-acetyltransferase [Candidatus Dormibacteraeota bacterium]|nr:GNAT family N-acetyltransferase [Candidatus Dormibacteraeota bacterium]